MNIVVVFPCWMIVVFVWNCSPFVWYHLIWILSLLSLNRVLANILFGNPFFFFPNDSMFWSRIIFMSTSLFEAEISSFMISLFVSMKVAIFIESPFFVSFIFFSNRSKLPPSAMYWTQISSDSFSWIVFVNCSIDSSEMLAVVFSSSYMSFQILVLAKIAVLEFGLDGSCGFADVMRECISCSLSAMISFRWFRRRCISFNFWVMKSGSFLEFIWFGEM